MSSKKKRKKLPNIDRSGPIMRQMRKRFSNSKKGKIEKIIRTGQEIEGRPPLRLFEMIGF